MGTLFVGDPPLLPGTVGQALAVQTEPTLENAREAAEIAEGACRKQRDDVRRAVGSSTRQTDVYVSEARESLIARMAQRLLADK